MLGRIKRAVRAAISGNSGIDGAAATCGKARQTAGGWNNLNTKDLPTIGDALALDEILIYGGDRPAILFAMAAELDYVAIPLPQTTGGQEHLAMQMADSTSEFGDVAAELVKALSNGRIDPGEDTRIVKQIDEAQASLAQLRKLVLNSVPSSVEER